MDSNGDGVGDFEGLIRRFSYLEMLGVDMLWNAPLGLGIGTVSPRSGRHT